MESIKLQSTPHRRFNPLTQEWVLVSPHRTQRPWLGKVEARTAAPPAYDPTCYLCPGNERAGGIRNPQYASTFIFENDFPALLPSTSLPDAPPLSVSEGGLLEARSESGICRVLCFSPRHDLAISRMPVDQVTEVVNGWAAQTEALAAIPWIQHVQIFENRGELMGASNPHPHCQIWASSTIPTEPAKELASFEQYRQARGSCLLCDYLQIESKLAERIVCENDSFSVVVPYWAVWPFETLVLSKRHAQGLPQLSEKERSDLAQILQRITRRYDNLFATPFPYSMGFHQQPVDRQPHDSCHLHAHYFPPLLRSATVQKFMVGFELLGTPQRDLTPEDAAARLREASEEL
jgi:UDPglucose--hexose-1-phosphate uridylyltransferase